jgi:hypothetical protein
MTRAVKGLGYDAASRPEVRYMDAYDAILARRTIRDFEDRKIAKPRTRAEAEARVQESGMTDPTQREMYLEAIPRQHSMIVGAGALIIPCFHEPGDLLYPRSLSPLSAFASIWCSIENILIAAATEGIFGVTRIPSAEEIERARELFGIPGAYQAPCFMALGYPRPDAGRTVQKAVGLKEKIHYGKW